MVVGGVGCVVDVYFLGLVSICIIVVVVIVVVVVICRRFPILCFVRRIIGVFLC